MLRKTSILAVASYISLALAAPHAARIIPREESLATRYIFAFGDSYSATGFDPDWLKPACSPGNPIGNPSFPGSTTSGSINWLGEVLDLAPNCTLLYNYAFVGATVNLTLIPSFASNIPCFINQTADFNKTVTSMPTFASWGPEAAAFAVWFGVNDVSNSYNDADASAVDNQDQIDFFQQLDKLYTHGGRYFLLLGTPPVNRTPSLLSNSQTDRTNLHTAIVSWNAKFAKRANAWEATHANSTVRVLDTLDIFKTILDSPKSYGAENATCYDSDGTTCLWWNNYHPGQAIQKAVGKAAFKELEGMGLF